MIVTALLQRRPGPLGGAGGPERRHLEVEAATYEAGRAAICEQRSAGVEGLVAKATASRYRPGARDWLKVKTRETAEVVVGAVTGSLEQPTSVIAGRYTAEGDFVVVGRTVRLQPAQSAGLARVLAAAGEHPWPPRLGGGFGAGPVDVVRVRPAVVAEVSADAARQAGHRWRHPLRLVRLRPDLTVADVDRA